MNRSVFAIEGMICEGCSSIAAKAIRDVPGVLVVEVSYVDGQAVVGTEACCTVPNEKLLAAIESAGYRGTFVPSEGSPHGLPGERLETPFKKPADGTQQQ
jgi:copper chaperone CopZ